MASDYVGFRMAPEMRAQIEAICQSSGITISEWIRGACYAALANTASGLGGVEEGYIAGRSLAVQMCHALLDRAREMLPATYEEALAHFQGGALAGPGRGGAG